MAINQEQLQGNWQQLKGKIHQQWGKLTDDDLTQTRGNVEQLVGKITERYGFKKEEAKEKLSQFLNQLDGSSQDIKNTLMNTMETISEKGHNLVETCQKFAKERPLATVGIIAAVGAVIGMLSARDSK